MADPAAPVPAPTPAPARARRASAVAAPDPQAAALQVMRVLPRAMDAMRLAMRAKLDGPLTVPQYRALNFVHRHPGSSVSALAGFLGVTLATASALVDRLVRAGYLQSQGSLADRRRSELTLCDGGKAVLERIRGQTRADLARALQGRTPAELQALVDGLGVLDAAFPRIEPDTRPA